MFLFIVFLFINLFISYFNAKGAGQIWAESKATGGWVRLLTWCGAIQAAIGFSMFYLVMLAFIAVGTGFIPEKSLSFLSSLYYIVIIVPLVGTGIIITIQSWINFAREKSLTNLGVAGWNTFAQAYNMYNMVNSFGSAFESVKEGFAFLSSDDDSDSDASEKVILLVILTFVLGIITTMVIIRKNTATLPVSEDIRDVQSADGTRKLEYKR